MRLLSNGDSNEVFISVENCVFKLKIASLINNERTIYAFDKSDGSSIISVASSKDGNLISAAYSNKWVCCWDSAGVLLGSILCNKRPTTLAYTTFQNSSGIKLQVLLISDKSGEIWGTGIPEMKNIFRLAGHTASVITDMAIAPCDSYLVTADRDEKIRVSNFPQLASISTYCLGHTNVVTSVGFITLSEKFYLVSSGWDHMLCLWDYTNGILLSQLQLSSRTTDLPSAAGTGNDAKSNTNSSASTAVVSGHSCLALSEGRHPNSNDDAEVERVDNDDEEDGVPEEEVDEVNEKIDGDLDEQFYDINKAGDFPLKIACSDKGYVAVIFKGRHLFQLYRVSGVTDTSNRYNASDISNTTDISYSTSAFALVSETNLGEMPCDILWSHEYILLLLPAPSYLKVFRVAFQQDICEERTHEIRYEKGHVTAVEDTAYLAEFRQFCQTKACDYSQQIVYNAHASDGDKGMQKHNLDRAYWRMQAEGTAPDPKLKARNKRSKRPRHRKPLEQEA